APVLHPTMLTNVLPAVRDGSPGKRHPQPGSDQIWFDPAVERNQAVLRERDGLGLLIGLHGTIPADCRASLVERALDASGEDMQIIELRIRAQHVLEQVGWVRDVGTPGVDEEGQLVERRLVEESA